MSIPSPPPRDHLWAAKRRAGRKGAEATDHFSDAVLQCGHDGAQAPEFQDHAGELVTGEAADGLQVLRFVADVVGADSGAGAIHHIVVKGEDDVGSC